MYNFDILIIGNGILGLSTAYALTIENSNLKIAVLGPFQRKGGATAASGAMLNCFSEIGKLTFKSKHGFNKFKLAQKALKLWPQWLEQINSYLDPVEKISIKPGTFVLLNTKAGQRETENYLAIRQTLMNEQESFEDVEPSVIPGLNPVDDARPLRALYLPHEGSLNPEKLLSALEKILRKIGNVTFMDETASQLLIENHQVIGTKTQLGNTVYASQVLLAAGAYTQQLIDKIPELIHRIPKILAGVGCGISLSIENNPFKHIIRTPLRAGSCGVHIVSQDSKNRIYLGASSAIRMTPCRQAKTRDIYYLLEHGMEQFNQDLRDAKIIKYRVGNRPITFDGFPLIGKTSIKGLWMLTGNYRDGLLSSSLLSSCIAKEMLQSDFLFDHGFQPERFPLEHMPKEELIEELVDQYISAGYEHAMKLPKLCWISDIREMAHTHISAIYQRLEIDMGLPSDLFIMLHYVPDMIPIFKDYYQAVKKEFACSTV
jgi:glycine oxidase